MATYRLDPAGFRENILNADWMVALMRERAEAGKAEAAQAVNTRTGHYVESLSVDAHKNGGVHGDRAEGVLSSSDDGALSIEFGTSDTEGQYPLTRAMGVMGS